MLSNFQVQDLFTILYLYTVGSSITHTISKTINPFNPSQANVPLCKNLDIFVVLPVLAYTCLPQGLTVLTNDIVQSHKDLY